MQNPAPQRFARRFKSFLKSTINQRVYLIESGKSKLEEGRIRPVIDRLKPNLDLNFTDEGAAKFLLRNRYDISQLIVFNSGYLKAKAEFDMYVTAAKLLTQTNYSHAN